MIYEPYISLTKESFLSMKRFIIDNEAGAYYFSQEKNKIYKIRGDRDGTNSNYVMGTVELITEDYVLFEFNYLGVMHAQKLFFINTAAIV